MAVSKLLLRCLSLDSLSLNDGARLSELTFSTAIGREHLASLSSAITPENLRNILYGVETENKESMYFFGLLKLYGISLEKDSEIALESFRKAGELGHAEAATAHGTMLLNGMDVSKDYSGAVASFRKGIQLGDKNAMWLLGKLLLEGTGVSAVGELEGSVRDVDLKEASQLFHLAAKEHIPYAEHHLGTMYEYGQGVQQDFALAMHFYQRAAEQSYMESMYHLALMHAYGRGCHQDFKTALPLLEGAARADHAPSCYFLGIFKMYGYGGEPDYEHAFNWFEKAAALNDFRVSATAREAADGLRRLVDSANEENQRMLSLLQRRTEAARD